MHEILCSVSFRRNNFERYVYQITINRPIKLTLNELRNTMHFKKIKCTLNDLTAIKSLSCSINHAMKRVLDD